MSPDALMKHETHLGTLLNRSATKIPFWRILVEDYNQTFNNQRRIKVSSFLKPDTTVDFDENKEGKTKNDCKIAQLLKKKSLDAPENRRLQGK